MTKLRSNQNGFGLLAVLLVVVVVGALAVVALRVRGSETPVGNSASTAAKASSKLTTKADVSQAAASLDSTNVDSSMNPDQLDSDLNSLL